MTWNEVRNRRGRRALDFGMVFAEHLRAMTDYVTSSPCYMSDSNTNGVSRLQVGAKGGLK